MTLFLAALSVLIALAIGYVSWRRTTRVIPVSRRLTGYAVVAGAILGAACVRVEALVLQWTGLDFDVSVVGAVGALLATFLLAAPLEEAAKVAVIWPLYRAHRIDRSRVGAGYAAAAGAGFAALEGALRVWQDPTLLTLVRAALTSFAHVGCAAAWGYALGAGRVRGRWFSVTWVSAVLLHGLFDHIVWGRGPGYLPAALPLLAFMFLGAWAVLRETSAEPSGRVALLEAPSLREVRQSLKASDKPVMLHWVVGGAFVTLGLIISLVALSILLGHRLGFDFSLADEADVRSAAPLVVLGTAVLLAFPVSGFLVARASGSPTVLEPALASLLALAALVAVLALTAPIAVLFALAVAPVALGLSCGGAWLGLER